MEFFFRGRFFVGKLDMKSVFFRVWQSDSQSRLLFLLR